MSVLRKMLNLASTERDIALAWLQIGAIFFAMRSCEYLKTAKEDSKRTKIIQLGNLCFKKDGKNLSTNSPFLHTADMVRVRFEFQKNDKRDVIVHMFKSGDKVLCPVIAWAATVKRVKLIKNSSQNSEVCLFQEKI